MTKRRRECLDCGSRWSTYEVEADRLDLLEDAVKRNAV
jgi:transcriptional regulator NrdR family protein